MVLTWQNRADACIAQRGLTNSKRPECFVEGVYPTHLTKGRGPYVWDTNGKKYIDFICGLGSSILGYGESGVSKVVSEAVHAGISLSLSTPYEVEVAELIKAVVPFIEKVKFAKNGSDACAAALKIARTKTGRTKVASSGYHGFSDYFISMTPPALGIPGNVKENMVQYPCELDESFAAVIVEPIMLEDSDKNRASLHDLREKCTKLGILLIFDEVITGFRVPGHTVSRYYGVEPDLICMGKAMGNGMPISVVGGKTSIMECGEYFFSSTFAGEMGSLAAAKYVITKLIKDNQIETLWAKGNEFKKRFNELWPGVIELEGYPTRGVFKFKDTMTKALFFQESCIGGILVGPSFFFNYSHMDDTVFEGALSTFRDVVMRIKTGNVELKGNLPKSPFAQQVREGKKS